MNQGQHHYYGRYGGRAGFWGRKNGVAGILTYALGVAIASCEMDEAEMTVSGLDCM